MKRVLELIMSLIATAATYALMHVVLFMDLFKFQHKLRVYVPTVIAVIVGLIFYGILMVCYKRRTLLLTVERIF